MKVYQDKDNCIDACVATMLGVKLKDIPDIRMFTKDGKDWIQELNKWSVKKHKKRWICLEEDGLIRLMWDGYPSNFIAVLHGSFHTEGVDHAIIMDKGFRIIHDPNRTSPKDIFAKYGLSVNIKYGLICVKI